MTSIASTYTANINTTYPVAGQDNDTQGFRDNFSNIYNAISAVDAQLQTVQTTAVFTTGTSNLNYNILQNASLQSAGYVVYDNRLLHAGGNQTIDFSQGNYQQWTINSATNFTVVNLPAAGTYATVKLELTSINTQTVTVTLVSTTGSAVVVDSSNVHATNPIVLTTTTGAVIYEISSADGGVTKQLKFGGGPYV
jgi:hypothetical protein